LYYEDVDRITTSFFAPRFTISKLSDYRKEKAMAKPQRVTYFKANLEDKPGTLLAVLKNLKSENIGLNGLWGYSTFGGKGELIVIPKDPRKAKNAWRSTGIPAEEGTGFFQKGTDKTGALLKSLEAIANAGVNIRAIDAVAVGGRYGTFIWVAPEEVEKAALALGTK